MSSTLFVRIEAVSEVKKHPNADNLDIITIGGWQAIVTTDLVKKGDTRIFIPTDSVVPEPLIEEWGIREYLGGKKHNRVRSINLRSIPSYGVCVPVPESLKDTKVGTNVADILGITKYMPPVRLSSTQGQASKQHPLCPKYTDMENLRNFPTAIAEGTLVQVSTKIHGSNFRIGLVDTVKDKQTLWAKFLRKLKINLTETIEETVAGSHNVMRKIPDDPSTNPYTFALSDPNFVILLKYLKVDYSPSSVVIYGEVFGPSIQKLAYGVESGYAYRVFDIKINGEYLPPWQARGLCFVAGVPYVPVVLNYFPYNFEQVVEFANGQSLIPNAKHIREGVVVKPMEPMVLPNGKRVIFKVKSEAYLSWKNSKKGSDFTEE